MPSETPTREDLATQYLDQLPYTPYPVQEEALLAWFTAEQGVLVCAPTGTGKTLIAQAALFEALHSGSVAYYTTPLIALTEQKFQEMQASAVRWGFRPEDIGLVTGNRRVNPEARVLVVVAEILLNRLLHRTDSAGSHEAHAGGFDFSHVSAVVMDEFHSFADPERGIVWELGLSMLPQHIRLLLLSATVGNAGEFLAWLKRSHGRKLELIEGKERKVPLTYRWVPDMLLGEQLVEMAKGDPQTRTTPALIFCFNRDECWSVAEQLKGLHLLGPEQRGPLNAAVAAGINLPARSVVLSALVKGPFGKEKLIDPSTAHQIFGRAGRPQYDAQGFVYALAHEDDVKILRWKEKYDQIPETTRDPALLKAKKDLKRKKPSRREGVKYWSSSDFERLKGAAPGKLYSKGPLPWRLLAYLLKIAPEVEKVRSVVRKRLMDESRIRAGEKVLDQMLMTLAKGGFVTLEPEPPPPEPPKEPGSPEEKTERPPYVPMLAHPTPALDNLLVFRSIHPLYGAFLLDHLGIADRNERIQALESVLEMPRPLLRYVRVPFPDQLPPGPLATERLDPELIQRGLIAAPVPKAPEDEEEEEDEWEERPPTLAEKLRLLFDAHFPDVSDVFTQSVWCAGELQRYEGNFNLYVKTRDLIKQEGIVDTTPEAWRAELRELSERLTASCRAVDPTSTDEIIQLAHAADVVEGEAGAPPEVAVEPPTEPSKSARAFGAGIFDD